MNRKALYKIFFVMFSLSVLLYCTSKAVIIPDLKEQTAFADILGFMGDGAATPPVTPVAGNNIMNTDTEKVLYVGKGEKYQSVQDAVYDANEGYTIYVKNGEYSEAIQINKDYITIQGEDTDMTVLGNSSEDAVISVLGTKGLIIKGFTINSSGEGISMENSDNCTISQCKINAKSSGINADRNSGSIDINECEISGTVSGYGVKSSSQITSVQNCSIYDNESGIYISSGSEVILEGNHIYNHKNSACYFSNVERVVIQDNNISTNLTGISYETTTDKVKTSGQISNNKLLNNNTGINLEYVCDISIENNYIIYQKESTLGAGIRIWMGSENNTVTKNVINNYFDGVLLDYYSKNNRIFLNDFISSEARDNSENHMNVWNIEGNGNYWSSYLGEDKNLDGIGDIPYPIKSGFSDSGIFDYYPLVKQQYNAFEPTPTIPTPTVTTPAPSPTKPSPTSTVKTTAKSSSGSSSKGASSGASNNTISIPAAEIPAAGTTPSAVVKATPLITATPDITKPPVAETGTPIAFEDIKNHWAKEYIDFIVQKGIMSGRGDGIFVPDAYATRAECAKVTTELLKKVSKNTDLDLFSDVSKDDWFYRYVYSAFNEGIMIGNQNSTFSPNTPVTRQDLALIFSRILVKYYSMEPVNALVVTDAGSASPPSTDFAELKGKIELPYNDSAYISKYALDGVATASNYGLFTGKPGNLFDPKGNTTRAELATILYKLITKYGSYSNQ